MENNFNYKLKISPKKRNKILDEKILKRCDNLINKLKELIKKIQKLSEFKKINVLEKDIYNIRYEIEENEEISESSDNITIKKNIRKINNLYRDVQNQYLNKKIAITNKNMKEIEEKTNEITGSAMFSIAAIFLGISLTSAIATGIMNIKDSYIILFLLTGGLIILFTIGISSILLRRFDKKSLGIIIALCFYCVIYGFTTYMTYHNSNNEQNTEIKETSNEKNEEEENIEKN